MKKALLIFIFISGFTFGQEIVKTADGRSIRLNSDKTWEFTNIEKSNQFTSSDFIPSAKDVNSIFVNNKNIQLENGESKLVDVKFSFISSKNDFEKIDLDKINSMIFISSLNSKSELKNPFSYIPRELTINYEDSFWNKWTVILKFTGTNSYGGELPKTEVYYFDNNGKEYFPTNKEIADYVKIQEKKFKEEMKNR